MSHSVCVSSKLGACYSVVVQVRGLLFSGCHLLLNIRLVFFVCCYLHKSGRLFSHLNCFTFCYVRDFWSFQCKYGLCSLLKPLWFTSMIGNPGPGATNYSVLEVQICARNPKNQSFDWLNFVSEYDNRPPNIYGCMAWSYHISLFLTWWLKSFLHMNIFLVKVQIYDGVFIWSELCPRWKCVYQIALLFNFLW